MSFLQQLKQQAHALQAAQEGQAKGSLTQTQATEAACLRVWNYFGDLSRQLNVIEPPAQHLGLDNRNTWPDMRQVQFRADARKKRLNDQEVFNYIALGWYLKPTGSEVKKGRVTVNFPPDLERVQRRLTAGHVVHERIEQRHPESNALLAIVFEYEMAARASVLVTADHSAGCLQFRLACVGSLEIVQQTEPAERIDNSLLDELARLVVGQPSRFLDPLRSR